MVANNHILDADYFKFNGLVIFALCKDVVDYHYVSNLYYFVHERQNFGTETIECLVKVWFLFRKHVAQRLKIALIQLQLFKYGICV